MNQVTRGVAKREGLLLIDLALELKKSSKLYYDWLHFNKEGAYEVGSILARHLCPYLKTRYSDFSKQASVQSNHLQLRAVAVAY